ncbi:MAG TPA: glycosyltransferase family 2 protein [Candidatus Coprenecus stercoravium]|uniref:Glycosyltransferase family 2 protein n=1 Tax=Candidatus Coprenecus stercoravium TaxID=2840735 RepID=A0A9D2GNT8_9BACT|nr:glycosyltransferase family 2 protein [Candidatus Coprenecus stercoravium]
MDLSIIISLYNENESLRELVEWIDRAIAQSPIADIEYEILMIDDGSDDGSWDTIKELSDVNLHIRAYSFRRNYGKSAALQTGFREAAGDVVITMDADLQDSPDEIPELYRMIKEDGYDLVSGWKKVRHDNTFTKNIPSKIYNFTARKVTGLKLHDMNCGLKAYRSEVVKEIEVYGDMHRYIPYIAKNAGFTKIGEKVVVHRKRKYGKSKFGMSRFFNGFLDLMTIWFLSGFGKKPMHIFGVWGIVFFLIGFVIALWLIIDKIISQVNGLRFRYVTDQPLFYLALVAILIGAMLFLTGFLGELISRNSVTRNEYKIKEVVK